MSATKSGLAGAVPGEEHAHVRERKRRAQAAQSIHHLCCQPSRQQEIEVPADFGATRIEPQDARQQARGEAGFRLLHRRDVDPHAADPRHIELGEQRVGRVLVDIDDAAASGHAGHGIEHAGIVAAIGARLDEHEARKAEPPRLLEIILERRERRRIAKLLVDPAVRVAVRRPEYVEMGVAALRWRGEQRCDITIGVQDEILEGGRGCGCRPATSRCGSRASGRRLIPFIDR